jgi:hypothetical protein
MAALVPTADVPVGAFHLNAAQKKTGTQVPVFMRESWGG